jgi:hypothetical protein
MTPTRSRRLRPDAQVVLTISAETLAGLDDNPGHLNGFGPVVASMARDIAATGTWRCAVTDARHGTLNGLGTSTFTPAYQPSEKLRRHLSVRDRTCRFPGCNTRAQICDVDHSTRHPEGATCECNTELLCGHHHRLKHESGFTVRLGTDPGHPPGTVVITTPGGRVTHRYPDPLDPNIAAFDHRPAEPGPDAGVGSAPGAPPY